MTVITRNIPNFITCLNIASGCLSIVCAFGGQQPLWGLKAYEWAYIFIGIAAVFDFLDGFAARFLHAYSNLGKELDSLCDLVSFGVAPAMILYQCLVNTSDTEWIRWCVFLIPIFGALRLARFNIEPARSDIFSGLPIPANAIFWIGFTALVYNNFGISTWLVLLAIIIISWLMVSPLKLISLKFSNLRWRDNSDRYLMIFNSLWMVFVFGVPGLMWIIIVYILWGVGRRFK